MSDEPEVKIPEFDLTDPAVLAALYSGFAFAEHYRKVVLSQCSELVRADYAARGVSITEARLNELKRVHPAYLDYLARHLGGRIKWEREVLLANGGQMGA